MIEEEANEIKNKFSTARRSMLEDTDSGQLDDIDVIPNEEMLLVCKYTLLISRNNSIFNIIAQDFSIFYF